MGYSKEIYDVVRQKLYELRIKSLEELERKKKLFFTRFPEASEIEKNLALVALDSARSVLGGHDAKKELERLRERSVSLRNRLSEILKSVNLPEDYLELKHNCEKCEDEGFVDGVMCGCMRDMLKKESYGKLNRMSPLELSSFDTFSLDYYPENSESGSQNPRDRMKIIFDFCKKYSDKFSKKSPNLIMMGNTGLGKTHLSLAIASEAISKGYGVIYVSAPNMVSKLEKEKFQNYGKDSEETEKHFIDCDLLIIDDLGTEYSNAFSNAAIYNIVNSRIMMTKPTIVSTNLTMKELEKNYSPRMVSRIIGNNIRLEFLGFDIRQKRLKDSFKR
ncbi:MAG: ATP-binding protein [Clostridia bacterium]|nr:ATP-binding protein [Clostridia bacterium]